MIFEGTEGNYRISSCRQYLVLKLVNTQGETYYELRQYCQAAIAPTSAACVEFAKNLEGQRIREVQQAAEDGRAANLSADATPAPSSHSSTPSPD